jgi:hypothetical protein
MTIAPSKKKNLKDKCLTVLEDDRNISIQFDIISVIKDGDSH